MRIWTVHPRHLDPVGLVAAWREGLLAQAVLLGRTRGYRSHPQLLRFKRLRNPAAGIAAYLTGLHQEAIARGYRFDRSRIVRTGRPWTRPLPETRGQLLYEWAHLGRKLRRRNRVWFAAHHDGRRPTAHPLFRLIGGEVRDWERPAR